MLRAIGAAVLGYIVMVACVMLCIAAAWFSLGSQFAFQGESTTASTGWSLVMLACGFVAAWVGGLVAAKVAGPHASLGVNFLMGLIAALGVASLLMSLNSPPLPLPEGKTLQDLSFAEAGQYAVSPTWYNVAIILAGLAGVLLGGRCCRGAKPQPPTQPQEA